MDLYEYRIKHFLCQAQWIASFWFGQACSRSYLDSLIQLRHSLGEASPVQSAIAYTLCREIVKPIIDFGVFNDGGQEAIKVGPVGTVNGVVTSVITDNMGSRGNNKMNESKIEENL